MTDLPAAAREPLNALLPPLVTPVLEQACDDGATRKTLWRGHDGTRAETVLMGYPDRATVCVSSQAGCGMACPFCATGQGGLQRNLSTGGDRRAGAAGRGGRPGRRAGRSRCGCPTWCSWAWASRWPTTSGWSRRSAGSPSRRPAGLGISARGVTVSTVGLVPAIDKLAAEGLPVTLAVSLHTPDDELRDTLVPVNNRWKVGEVLAAARRYAQATGRRVSIEYALIRDVNDQPWRADLLGHRAAPADRQQAGARQPDPAQPDAGQRVGRLAAPGAGRVRAPGAGRRGGLHGAGHPRPGDRRRLRSAGRAVLTGPGACGAWSSSAGAAPASRRWPAGSGVVTGLPVVELDAIFWRADLTGPSPEQWSAIQRDLTRGEQWILDGDLGPHDEPAVRLAAAATVIVLDFSLARCAWRAVRRGREEVGFWRWLITYRRRWRPRVLAAVARSAPDARLHVFRGPRAVRRFLARATAHRSP